MYTAFVEFGKPIDDYSELKDYSFGMGFGPSAGGANRIAQRNGLQFRKVRDSLSAALFQACASATVFGTVWLEVYKDDNDYPGFVYTMSQVQVSAINSSGDGSESVALNFKTLQSSYAGR